MDSGAGVADTSNAPSSRGMAGDREERDVTRGDVMTRRRPVGRLALAGGAALVVLLSGCQTGGDVTVAGAQQVGQTGQGTSPSNSVSLALISVDPAPSSEKVSPAATVTVSASQGTLTTVSVRAAGGTQDVDGALAPDSLTWTSSGTLAPSTTYYVRASAVDAKGVATSDATIFSTAEPKAVLKTSISPINDSTVGVGMPIIVRFTEKVTDRAAVERALSVSTVPAIQGGWSWLSNTEVHYRTRTYWAAGTAVTLRVNLAGVDAGNGVYGMKNRIVRFHVGASMVSTVDVAKHTLTVRRNGKVAKVIPITTGKAGFLTRNGTKVVIEKFKLKVMDASTIGIAKGTKEYYRLEVPYALRVTYSGEFVHAAPWSVANQGRANVSHGCVGMSLANGIWLYNQTRVGDVVTVVNSPRHLEPGNGWTDWNVPWSTWLAGSALA
jgi:lipoprotein-anchoring transpeptidase ErfK/SrfK